MKILSSLCVSGLLAISVLAGCGGGTDSTDSTESEAAGGSADKVVASCVKNFNSVENNLSFGESAIAALGSATAWIGEGPDDSCWAVLYPGTGEAIVLSEQAYPNAPTPPPVHSFFSASGYGNRVASESEVPPFVGDANAKILSGGAITQLNPEFTGAQE